jgi:hypothetical protein
MKNISVFLTVALSLVAVKASAHTHMPEAYSVIPVHDHHHHHHHHHSSSSSSSSSSGLNWGMGLFGIKLIDDCKVFLSNNKFYEGVHDEDKVRIRSWVVGDQVQMIGTKHRRTFLLLNSRTNKMVKVHITSED